jgi:hypothetical protein
MTSLQFNDQVNTVAVLYCTFVDKAVQLISDCTVRALCYISSTTRQSLAIMLRQSITRPKSNCLVIVNHVLTFDRRLVSLFLWSSVIILRPAIAFRNQEIECALWIRALLYLCQLLNVRSRHENCSEKIWTDHRSEMGKASITPRLK